MKKSILLLLVLVLSVYSFSLGQGYKGQGKIKGVVTDQVGNPVEGVKIKMYSQRAASGFEVTSDADGKWRAFYIRGGPYDIELEKSGYMPKKLNLTISEYNANPDVDFVLEKIEGMVLTEDGVAASKVVSSATAVAVFGIAVTEDGAAAVGAAETEEGVVGAAAVAEPEGETEDEGDETA